MAKVSLRIYNREIESLIEHGQLDEALAHCGHILRSFPKNLETYRLLGKAYLEGKRYKEAVDIFQRVLVCVPDDFVSHVGMSIISDDQTKLDEAIWHMERAFEVQPSNAAIQGELQRLFGRRDGVEPPKIRLTRGALAHMYVQGELYSQAVSEIRAVLANDAQRTDMQVLLARAYFRGGQKNEAAEICSALLKRFPYCLDANRIMLEIPTDPHRSDTVQVYRHRVTELDPYAAFAQDSVFRSDAVTDAAVSLERFEYVGQQAPAAPAWGGALGIGLQTDATAIGPSNTQPDWLKNAAPMESAPAPAAPAAVEPEPEIPDFMRQSGWGESTGAFQEGLQPFAAEPETPAEPAVQADLPDWIRAMEPDRSGGTMAPAAEPEPSVSTEAPDWLRDLGKASRPAGTMDPAKTGGLESSAAEPEPAASSEAPDWLRNLGGAPSRPVEATSQSDTSVWLRNLDKQEASEAPAQPKPAKEDNWLRDLGGDEPAQQPGIPSIETPDWVKDLGPKDTAKLASPKPLPKADLGSLRDLGLDEEPAAPQPMQAEEPAASESNPAAYLGNLGTSEQEQDDAMAWLESLAAKHGAKAEELVTDPKARSEVAPDWVDKAKAMGEAPAAAAPAPEMKAEPAAPRSDETGSWLRNLEAAEDNSIATKRFDSGPAQNEPDWLSKLTAEEGEPPRRPVNAEEPAMPKIDTPDWLAGLDAGEEETAAPSATGEQPAGQSEPDWLGELGLAKNEENTTRSEVPDWLNSETSAPAAPAAPQELPSLGSASDLPDWLAGLDREDQEQAPAASSATSSSDEELPPWLHAEEAQPQATEPASPADWKPAASEELPRMPKPLPRQPISREPEFPMEEPEPARKPAPKPQKPAPAPPRPKPAVAPKDDEAVLTTAQQEMERGNIGAAVDIYGRLIRKGKSLEESIRDLREALYRFPVEVGIWQALGDAYMRANRLQEALDAYTKAEELLR